MEIKIKPKKYLGQYFLKNKKILDQILKTAALKKNDLVLEVGPGTGILTKQVLENAGKVIAVEKDREMVRFLKQKFKNPKLAIIHQDILKFNLKQVFKQYRIQKKSFKIIANLPYYLTGAFLSKFVGHFMVLMIQKEIAQRIMDKKNSILSIGIKSWARPKIISYVKSSAFWPRPKIDSAVIKLIPRNKKYKINFELVKRAFNQRRKQIGSTLDKNLLEKAGINRQKRPEELSLKEWQKLSTIAY